MTNKAAHIRPGRGWAWAVRAWRDGKEEWQLCHWAVPSRQRLIDEGKPSPEAKPIYVLISKAKP